MKILVLSSHTPSLFWFRLEMMQAFQANGAEVIAVGPDSESKWIQEFIKYGIEYRSIPVSRNGLNVMADLKTFKALKKIIKEIKPNKIFTYQAKTIVYGALAAKIAGVKDVYPLVAGLGSIFRGDGIRNKIIKTILCAQYKLAFRYSKKVIFQNRDDKMELIRLGILNENKCFLINGSGVNTTKFVPVDFPNHKAILFIGRLIGDKGIREYIELSKRIKEKRKDIRCLLVGPYDTNPSAIKPEELFPYIENGNIEYFGEQKDVRPFIAQCTVFVLPSYHEGTPKTVLEAMSMGRPIVTTDAPGCRDTVLNNQNGYLVPIKNIDVLEKQVLKILDDDSLAKLLGSRGRQLAKEKYDVNKVNQAIIEIIEL